MDSVTLVEKIMEKAPSFTANGKTYYVVERDIQLEENELMNYANSVLTVEPRPQLDTDEGPLELTAATLDGRPIRWALGTKLTWAIDSATFPSDNHAHKAQSYAEGATADWNATAQAKELDIRFAPVKQDATSLFQIEYQNFGNPNLYAVAFFPNDPAFKRVVRVGPALFESGSTFDPIGVMRHELGHVLGFRHEHIRPEAPEEIEPWVVGDIGAEVLSKYDARSLMHYPMGEGFGTTDFKITDIDKQGFAALYSKASDEVREFSP